MTYAECFNILLKENDISKQELARKLGVSGTAVYKKFRLNQFSNEDISIILKLCKANVTIMSNGDTYSIDN